MYDRCEFCGRTGGHHDPFCDTLAYDDSEDVAEDLPTIAELGHWVECHGQPVFVPDQMVPDEAPRDPVPTEAELDDCFRALMSHDVAEE